MRVPQPGDQVGRYRLERVLGEGANATVLAATDPRLDRTVAVTVARPELVGRPGFAAAFQDAATRLSGLTSPYVAQVHDHGTDGECPYLVSQYVAGGDLAAWLRGHGRLPQRDALLLVEQVCAGLADAHRAGLVHGDVRAGHVLVRDPGTERAHAWLTGFPLTTVPAGAEAGLRRADLQGIGRLLVACLTGAEPDPAAPPPPPGAFGPNVDGLLGRLLGPDPGARPADADALRAELASLAALWAAPRSTQAPATAPAAPSAPPTATAAPARRRGRLLGLVAAAVVLVLVAGGIAWAVLRGDGGEADAAGTPAAVTGDLDGDGHGDVLLDRADDDLQPVGESVILPFGDDGVGEPVRTPYPDAVDPEQSYADVQLADVDGDGRTDRIYTSYPVSVPVLVVDVVPADGDPWHQEIRYDSAPWGAGGDPSAKYGDLDQDGRADLIVYDEYADGKAFGIFVGTAQDGAFAEPEQWYSEDHDAQIVQLDVADFDGDGEHDVLAAMEGGDPWDIELQLITSDGSRLADAGGPRSLGPGNFTQGVRLYGDLDGDGSDEPLLLDASGIATTHFTDGASPEITTIWQPDAESRHQWEARINRWSSSATISWAMSDVDGDGDDDLVLLRWTAGDDGRNVTVRYADDGRLGEPTNAGEFVCTPDCPDYYRPVAPAY